MPFQSQQKNETISFAILPEFLFFFTAIICGFLFFDEKSFLTFGFEADMAILALAGLGMSIKRQACGLNFLIATLSYCTHVFSADAVGTFPELYLLSWLSVTALLIFRPDWSDVAIAYHFGLSFDAAMTRTTGLGMQTGFYASIQVILCLAGVLRSVWNDDFSFKADLRHFLLFAAALITAGRQFFAFEPGYTDEILMLVVSTSLFWTIARPERKKLFIGAIVLSGSIIALISIGNLFILAENSAEVFARRAWAAGAHPNKIATWAFSCLMLLIAYGKASSFDKPAKRLLQIFLWTTIILTGARIILALTIFAHLGYYGANLWRNRHARLIAASVAVVSLARILKNFNWAELLKNERLMIWYSAWQNIIEKPLMGHGLFPMSFLPQRFPEGYGFWLYDWNYPHAHQLFLELLLWGGVFLLSVFAGIFIIAWRKNPESSFRLALIGVLATGILDFAWGTPALFAIASFFLFYSFFPAQRVRRVKLPAGAKALLLMLVVAGIIGSGRLLFSVRLFEKSTVAFSQRSRIWLEQATMAAETLKEPFPLMHLLLRKAAAGSKISDLIREAQPLSRRFPNYYVVWFLRGRLFELDGSFADAVRCYRKAVQLEPRDLNGIRHARLLLNETRLGGNLQGSADILAEVLKRGSWGTPIIVNHPEFGSRFADSAAKALETSLKRETLPEIEKLYMIKNSVEWGIMPETALVQAVKTEEFPDWLEDEFASSKLVIKSNLEFKFDAGEAEAAILSAGPALCRAIAKLALREGFPELAIEAYNRHRQVYNYRGKNYEDLHMQFLAARAFIELKMADRARNELDRIAAFDFSNPFVFELLGDVELVRKNPEKAIYFYDKAAGFAMGSSYMPYFKPGANDDNWPEGDHWTLVIEKTLRHRDLESRAYCRKEWLELIKSLKKKAVDLTGKTTPE